MIEKWHRFLERFWTADAKNIGIVCGLIALQVVTYLLKVLEMTIPSVMIDWVLPGFTMKKLEIWAAAGLLIYIAVRAAEGIFSGYLYFKYEILLTEKRTEEMMQQVMEKKVHEVDQYNEGYLMNLVFNDVTNVVSVSVQMLIRIPATCICIAATLILLWEISPALCLVQMIMIPLYVMATFAFQKEMQKVQIAQREKKDVLDSSILSILNHKKAVKLTKRDDFFQQYIISRFQKYIVFILKYWRVFFKSEQFPMLVVNCGNMAMLGCGIWLYIHGRFSMGMLVWVGTIGSLLSEQLKDLCTRFLRRMANDAAYLRVDEFKDQKGGKSVSDYEYEGDETEICRAEISAGGKYLYEIPEFKIREKGLILLEGANGSGKSTMLNWLLDIIPMENGKLKEDGKVKLAKDMFERTSYLSSPDILVNGAVLENILLGDEKSEKTDEILKMLGIDFADKEVVTKPLNLSFGEQQKIFLARALNRKSDYLFLDEPTTNLDIETKKRLLEYLKKLSDEKCIVLIGHDKEMEEIADDIYRIENGSLQYIG